jgi:hypothetical protein
MKKVFGVFLIATMLVFSYGCPKSQTSKDLIAKAAQAIDAISIAAEGASRTVIEIMPENTQDRRDILNIIAEVVKYDSLASMTLQNLNKISEVQPKDIATVIVPMLQQMKVQIDSGVLGIKNLESQRKAKMWLDGLSIAITSAQGVLQVYIQ